MIGKMRVKLTICILSLFLVGCGETRKTMDKTFNDSVLNIYDDGTSIVIENQSGTTVGLVVTVPVMRDGGSAGIKIGSLPGFIGEVYFENPILFVDTEIEKFRASDVSDEVGDNIKIFGVWCKKSNVFYYDDIYNEMRGKIRNE